MSGLEGLSREELIERLVGQQQEIEALRAEVEMLRSMLCGGGSGSSAAPFIKPNRKERREAERAERKKRKHSFVRRRDVATEEVRHAVEVCPDCGRKLVGGWEHSRRQVIDIPREPARVIEHVLVARRCGVCGVVHIPKLTIADGVVGKMRLGVNLISLIATLSVSGRMPQRIIVKLVEGLYGLHVSVGEISEVLHRVADWSKSSVCEILRKIRGSPDANADETGWREDGVNGYLWSVSTATERFYYFHRRRAFRIIGHILGSFSGVLGCDFYVGYDPYAGPKQRCWVHLLRDLAKLAQEHADKPDVLEWIERVKDIYKAATKAARCRVADADRTLLREELQERLCVVCEPYSRMKGCAQHVLAKRICKYIPELFTFVEHPNVASCNNAAERTVRPAVIARKISGGTRSARGSQTRMRLMSVFATWALQGREPIAACAQMIIAAQQASTPTPAL